MLSRHVLLKSSLKPALKCIKVENMAHIHFGSPHFSKLPSLLIENVKNYRTAFSSMTQVRYESSNSTTQVNDGRTTTGLDDIPEPPLPLSEITQSAVEGFTGEPSFASLGLGGWTPVGWVQNGLEFLHVSCGLPWWEAVICGTLLVRILMFPIIVISQRNAAKLNNNLPQLQYIQAKMSEARQRGDKFEAAKYSGEMMKFMDEKKVNPFKNMIPPLCQAPVFISVFMGLRGMASLPVESLKTGGALWFVDLTVPDQFYLLPILTSATLYCTIKLGVDGGQPTQNMLIAKYIFSAIPVIVLPFTIKFHGLMLVYWASSNFISLAQVGLLRIPKVRKFFKIEQLIQHPNQKLAIKDKGFIGNVKDAWNNMKITGELDQRQRADRMAFLQAGREPIKKTYKYDPTKVKNQTSIQAKKSI